MFLITSRRYRKMFQIKFLCMPMKTNFIPCKRQCYPEVRLLHSKACILDYNKKKSCLMTMGERGGAVGWDTAPQTTGLRARFSMVSLEFFIDINLPAAIWPWSRLSLQQKWVPEIFPGVKGGRYIGLTNLPTSYAGCLNLREPSGLVQACTGITLTLIS